MFHVKEFLGSCNNEEFYRYMGKYFAERIYRKELPYLINDQDKIWYLFFHKEDLMGFCGVVMNQNNTTFTDFYVNYNYRNPEAMNYMSTYMLDLYKSETIRILTNSENEMKMWERLGFLKNGQKGSYTTYVYGIEDESKN